MKKVMFFIVALAVLGSVWFICVGADNNTAQVAIVQFPIKVDNVYVTNDATMLNMNGSVYLPIRALCDMLEIEIEWKKEREIAIVSNANVKVGNDYNGWRTENLELTEEEAGIIADIVLLKGEDEEYIEGTELNVIESKDKTCYRAFRSPKPPEDLPEGHGWAFGGGPSVTVRKSDGKVMNINTTG